MGKATEGASDKIFLIITWYTRHRQVSHEERAVSHEESNVTTIFNGKHHL